MQSNLKDKNPYKKDILEKISISAKKKLKKVKTLFLNTDQRFGNALIALSNTIYYCEKLFCKEILVDSNFPLIKNKIHYEKYNMIINKKSSVNCSDPYTACLKISFFYFYRFNKTHPEQRMYLLQKEIYNNIPKYKSNKSELYIHIRAGDIFEPNPHCDYVEPPLCFYEHILSSFFFKKIFIVSEDKNNPVIDALLRKYPNIYYLNNNFEQAVSYIINARNLITSMSSFSLNLIRISKSIKTVFWYNFFPQEQKFYWLMKDWKEYNERYKSIVMDPLKEYINIVYPWGTTKQQLNAMVEYKCNTTLFIL